MRRFGRLLFVMLLLVGACSDDDGDEASSTSTSTGSATTDGSATDATSTSTTAVERPEGPAADISEELTGGEGVFIGAVTPYEPDPGYVQEEYVAAGTATAYVQEEERTADGQWTVEPGENADYRTRVVVRRPEN